jgi:hypothetical protein
MLGRALSLATVTFLIGCLMAGAVRAQENLDAGKSPSQIFSSTCSACHKSPRGLLRNTSTSSLPGFLRQHYTTGSEMARVLAGYLISNGAADPRYQAKDQPRQRDPGRRQPAAAAPQDPSEAAPPQRGSGRQGRDSRRYARPQSPEAGADDGLAPDQSATERRSSAKQKSRRGKRAVEEPKHDGDAAKQDASKAGTSEPSAASPGPSQTAPADTARPAGEPSREERSGSTGTTAPRESAGSESGSSRPDPAPSAPSTTSSEPPAASATPTAPSSGESGSTSR